jgi:hypothetical protein
MDWRQIIAPWFSGSTDPQDEGVSSNMKMMMIAAGFLIVTIGLILMQPGRGPQQMAALDQEIIAPTAAVIDQSSYQTTSFSNSASDANQDVTRSDTSLLSLSQTKLTGDVSKMLRSPIRLSGQQNDLRQLAKTALENYGHTAEPGDKLYDLFVQALAEGQSNAYIDALLNTSAGRGDFDVPVALQTASGRLDTDALLYGLVSLVNP